MGLVTWYAAFTLSSPQDTVEEVADAFNDLIGADLQRKMNPGLQARGWDFDEGGPEDHGWHSGAVVLDEGKRLVADLVTCGELDPTDPPGRALDDRWSVVVGLEIGMFAETKARRMIILKRLGADVESVCRELGAADFQWDPVAAESLAKA